MSDPTILVTGATDGIGKQTALELAKSGATVIVHGRNRTKCEAAAREIRKATGNEHLEAAVFDLASLAAIRTGASDLAHKHPVIDVLINNAGVYMNERTLTVDGLETTFAVNYVAPFLLTHLLMPCVEAADAGRIVTVSSMVHRSARLDMSDLQSQRSFSGFVAYARSKLANVLFTIDLAERLRGRSITTNCLHPGVIATKLLRDGFGSFDGGSLERGAATSVYLALSPAVAKVSGRYFDDEREAQMSPLGGDRELRRELWQATEKLCGVSWS